MKPQEVAGWEITITEGPYEEPVELHGDTLTQGVKEVSWTGGPLPDHHMQQFGLSMKMPDQAGETIYFPVVQTCQQGVNRWIAIPLEGEDEPEEPAPGVKLLPKAEEAGGDAGASQPNTAGEEKSVAGDEAGEAEPVAQAGQVQDDNNGLAVVALVVGIAGLLTGGASFLHRRS